MKRIITLSVITMLTFSLSAQIDFRLQAHYLFNANANDQTLNAYHGTVNGGTLVSDHLSNANSAYQLNGTTDYIDLPEDFDYTNFTLVTWFKVSSFGTTPGFIYSSDHAGTSNGAILLSVVNKFGNNYLNYSQSFQLHRTQISTNEWYMASITVSDDSARYYLCGQLLATFPKGYLHSQAGCNYATLGTTRVHDRNFHGTIDDTRIYDRALTQNELYALCLKRSAEPTHIDNISKSSFDIYPNPSTDITHVQFQNTNNENYVISIYNTNGQLVKTIETTDSKVSFNNDEFSNGIYILKLSSQKSSVYKKFIVKK